jgi:hypothetical protein
MSGSLAVGRDESRRRPRFVMRKPVAARFAGFDVVLHDVSESGCHIRHADPLKIGCAGTLQFVSPVNGEELSFECRLIWSRLVIDESGRTYHSGAKFRGINSRIHAALAKLVTRCGDYDHESLRKKRLAEERKKEDRRRSVAIYKNRSDIPADLLKTITDARDFLQLNPTVALKWYQRGRFARMNLAEADVQIPYADNVLAVWELLGRRYPLTVVALALSR